MVIGSGGRLKPPTTIQVPMKTWRVLAGLALIAAVLIAGCAGVGSPGGGSGTPTTAIRASVAPTRPAPAGGSTGTPAVLILDPPFDGGVASGTVTVAVQVTGFTLVPPGEPNRPGAGHLVYYRDVTPGTQPGETALTAPGTYATSSETVYSWKGVAPGTHTFAVQLVNADDTPLDPPAIDAVDVTAVSSEMIQTR
jgi:hypothetical protein